MLLRSGICLLNKSQPYLPIHHYGGFVGAVVVGVGVVAVVVGVVVGVVGVVGVVVVAAGTVGTARRCKST